MGQSYCHITVISAHHTMRYAASTSKCYGSRHYSIRTVRPWFPQSQTQSRRSAMASIWYYPCSYCCVSVFYFSFGWCCRWGCQDNTISQTISFLLYPSRCSSLRCPENRISTYRSDSNQVAFLDLQADSRISNRKEQEVTQNGDLIFQSIAGLTWFCWWTRCDDNVSDIL